MRKKDDLKKKRWLQPPFDLSDVREIGDPNIKLARVVDSMEALFERTLEVKSHLLPVDNRSKRERQSYWQKRVIEAFSGRSLGIIDTLSQPSALDIKNSTGALIRLQELCSKLQVSRIDNGQFLFS